MFQMTITLVYSCYLLKTGSLLLSCFDYMIEVCFVILMLTVQYANSLQLLLNEMDQLARSWPPLVFVCDSL